MPEQSGYDEQLLADVFGTPAQAVQKTQGQDYDPSLLQDVLGTTAQPQQPQPTQDYDPALLADVLGTTEEATPKGLSRGGELRLASALGEQPRQGPATGEKGFLREMAREHEQQSIGFREHMKRLRREAVALPKGDPKRQRIERYFREGPKAVEFGQTVGEEMTALAKEEGRRIVDQMVVRMAGGATFGISDAVIRKLAEDADIELTPQATMESIASGVSQLIGTVISAQGLAKGIGTLAKRYGIEGTKALLARRMLTAGTIAATQNTAQWASGQKTGVEAARDGLIQTIASGVGMIPETFVKSGVGNFVAQVATDFLYDLATDAFFRDRFKDQTFVEWFFNEELLQLAPSIAFASLDYFDTDFETNRQKAKVDIINGIKRAFRMDIKGAEEVGTIRTAAPEAARPAPDEPSIPKPKEATPERQAQVDSVLRMDPTQRRMAWDEMIQGATSTQDAYDIGMAVRKSPIAIAELYRVANKYDNEFARIMEGAPSRETFDQAGQVQIKAQLAREAADTATENAPKRTAPREIGEIRSEAGVNPTESQTRLFGNTVKRMTSEQARETANRFGLNPNGLPGAVKSRLNKFSEYSDMLDHGTAVEKFGAAVKIGRLMRKRVGIEVSEKRGSIAKQLADLQARKDLTPEDKAKFASQIRKGAQATSPIIDFVSSKLTQADADEVRASAYKSEGKPYDVEGASDAITLLRSGVLPKNSEMTRLMNALGLQRINNEDLPGVGAMLAGTYKAWRAGMDISAMMRQLRFNMFGPGAKTYWTKVWPESLRAMVSEENYQNTLKAMREDPEYQTLKGYGSDRVTDAEDIAGAIEEFAGLEAIRGWAPQSIGGKALKSIMVLLRPFERQYGIAGDMMRHNWMKTLNETHGPKEGMSSWQRAAAVDRMIEFAKYTNALTGRGNVPPKWEGAFLDLVRLMWSPRFVLSRFQTLKPLFDRNADPEVRKLAAKSMFALIASQGTILALADLAGGETDWNPTSSDFGKIKIGNTRLDTTAGMGPVFRLFARMAARMRKSGGKASETTGGDELAQFLLFKKGPLFDLYATAHKLLLQELFPERDIKHWGGDDLTHIDLAKKMLPMIAESVWEALEDSQDPTIEAPVAGLGEFLGAGSQTYSQKQKIIRPGRRRRRGRRARQ